MVTRLAQRFRLEISDWLDQEISSVSQSRLAREYLQNYPSGNRITSNRLEPRFPPVKRFVISELGQSECHSSTGLSQSQLLVLYRHLRNTDTWTYEDRHPFHGLPTIWKQKTEDEYKLFWW